MQMIFRTLGFVLVLLCLGPFGMTSAKDRSNQSAVVILEQQRQIRSDAEAGQGRYKNLDPRKREELYSRQDRVAAMLDGVAMTAELPDVRQVELFNTLEAIEAIVNDAEDDRMICERFKPVGSNRPQTICRTVAERREEREGSVRDMGRRTLECSEATMGPGGCAN